MRPTTTSVSREHIEIVEGTSGRRPRIAGHNISVMDITIWHEKLDISADIIAALADSWDNSDEMEQTLHHDGALVTEFREQHAGSERSEWPSQRQCDPSPA